MRHTPLISEKTESALRRTFQSMQTEKPVRVPSERALAETLGVSRVSVRKAFQRMLEEGLLSQRQGIGTYVMPKAVQPDLHVLCSPEIKAEDPFYLKFLAALAAYAGVAGVSLSMRQVGTTSEGFHAEPLIVMGPVPAEIAAMLENRYDRIISVHDGCIFTHALEIRFDDRNIGRSAARILLAAGFRNMAILAGPSRYDSASERRTGFLEVTGSEGLQVRLLEEKMNWAGGIRAAEVLLAGLPASRLPEALFAANDWMALGCMQRLGEAGIRIPEDISIIGCDNIPLSSEFLPSLATFDLDMNLLVSEIMDRFARNSSEKEAREGGGMTGGRLLLPASFIRRESIRAPSTPLSDSPTVSLPEKPSVP